VTGSRGTRVVGLLAIAWLTGCGGAASHETARAAKATRERADAAFFAHIPADTPYLYASTEPVPRSFWRRMRPVAQALLDALPRASAAAGPGDRFGAALVREVNANLDEAGLLKVFGMGPNGRFAVYGIGLLPVLRVELADSKALLATIERLRVESGAVFPTATIGGRTYWRLAPQDGKLFVAAVIDGQLVLSLGPTASVDEALPLILGTERPASSMGSGGPVAQLVALHRFPAYGVGFVDIRRLIGVGMGLARRRGNVRSLPPACKDELSYLLQRFPRVVFGFDELSGTRLTMRAVLETDAALAARLEQLVTDVPGLVGGLPADRPFVAIGVGVDLAQAVPLVRDAAEGFARIGRACAAPNLVARMDRLRAALLAPPPAWFGEIEGGMFSTNQITFGPNGKPNRFEGYLIAASEGPVRLLELARRLAPGLSMLSVDADGKFHDAFATGGVPGFGTVRVAIKPGALVAAIGDGMVEAAERTLARSGRSPLLYMAYDYPRVADAMAAEKRAPVVNAPAKVLLSMIGMSAIWTYPTDHGLAVALSLELR
jgi:hypothetical protein